MKIKRITLDNCHEAAGLVVVIDVLRAFTTAAFAFDRGVKQIVLVSTVEEAFVLREQMPDTLIMGEVRGIPPEGFDFGNSPYLIAQADVDGRSLIQRTSAGTQGVVCGIIHADTLLASSFVVAQATADFILNAQPAVVTLLITDSRQGYGSEDVAFADYLEALLLRQPVDAAPFLERVRLSRTGRKFAASEIAHFEQDVQMAMQLDRFPFAMQVTKHEGLFRMQPVSLNH